MKIIKTKVNAKTRPLNANWTVEQSQDIEHQISDELAKIMQEEIDREIIEEITSVGLVEQGWTKVPNYVRLLTIDEMQNWLAENTTDEYKLLKYSVCFKNYEDATLYILKWAGDETTRT